MSDPSERSPKRSRAEALARTFYADDLLATPVPRTPVVRRPRRRRPFVVTVHGYGLIVAGCGLGAVFVIQDGLGPIAKLATLLLPALFVLNGIKELREYEDD